MAFRQLTLGQGVARLTVIETLVSPLRPAAATLLQPASISSIYSLGAALMIAFAWLALRRKRRGRPVVVKALVRAIFSRRVLLHRSTFADLAYCVIGLATLGAIIGWAVVSTSWISDGVAASLRARQETTESGARWGIPKFGIVSYARACSMLL